MRDSQHKSLQNLIFVKEVSSGQVTFARGHGELLHVDSKNRPLPGRRQVQDEPLQNRGCSLCDHDLVEKLIVKYDGTWEAKRRAGFHRARLEDFWQNRLSPPRKDRFSIFEAEEEDEEEDEEKKTAKISL